MFEITHQQARLLLQAAADRPLGAEERTALQVHLAHCQACSQHAGGLASLEDRLREAMRARWDLQRPGLDLGAILHPPAVKPAWGRFLGQGTALGKVAILAALFLGYVLVASLFGLRSPLSGGGTPASAPTPNEPALAFAASPTPPAHLTSTGLSTQGCETLVYIVQANDTLESIAMRHGATKEAILAYNVDYAQSASQTVFAGMQLVIPLCRGTPSQTATTTLTPILGTLLPVQPE